MSVLTRLALNSIAANKNETDAPTTSTELNPIEIEAKKLLSSKLIPEMWKNIPDLTLIIELARKMHMPVATIAENLVNYNGSKGWKASFIISCINSSKNFSSILKFKEVGNKDDDSWGYYAFAKDNDGDIIKSPCVTVKMAKESGWYHKEGSVWPIMTELLLQYRSASIFGRLYAPEILMGMQSVEELRDISTETVEVDTELKPLDSDIVIKEDEVENQKKVDLKPKSKKSNKKTKKEDEVLPYEKTDEYNLLVKKVEELGFMLSAPTSSKKDEQYWIKATASTVFADHEGLLKECEFIHSNGLYVKNITTLLQFK